MVRRFSGRPLWLSLLMFALALAVATPALAQGVARGVVKDDKGQPVADAKVLFEMTGAGTGRKYETKSDKKGEFIQVGLASGPYDVRAEKDKLASNVRGITVRAGAQIVVQELVLAVASAAAAAENAAKGAALKKVFEEGVALSTANKHQEAIAKFNEGIAVNDRCADCYNNIGYSYTQLKDWDKAEAAYKKSTEIRPDDAVAYNGLATVYNGTRKFDLADAHYLLGMSLVGIDPPKAVPEFEAYLKLAPSGPADKVKMANDIIAAFKK
jgi:tetratricopeptide (TPR) repeat protein